MKIAIALPKPASRLSQGYLICFTGTVVWSTTAIFIRYLTETYHLPALVLAFWRDLIVSLALGAALALVSKHRLRLDRRHLKLVLFYGLVLAVFNTLWTVSVALNGAAVSTVLAYSSAAFTALFGWSLLGERLGAAKVLAVLLSLAGCAFVSGAVDPLAWRLNPLGIVTGLLAGLAFAGYSLLGKTAARRSIYPWTTLLYAFGFATLFLLAFNLIAGGLAGAFSSSGLFWLGGAALGWGILALLAVGPTIGGFGLYTVSLNYLPASVANIIATLEPAMTAGLAYLLLGERLTLPQLFGSCLIIGGVIVLRLLD